MKVLIMAVPRSGSTSLMSSIASEKNLERIFEPFSYRVYERNLYTSDKKNVVVKLLVGQDSSYPKKINYDRWLSWSIEFVKEFDEVILLSRKNIKEASESYSNALWTDNWHDKYEYTSLPNIGDALNHLTESNKYLNSLSEKTSIPITYYEDIYDTSSSNRLRSERKKAKKLF